MNIIDKLNSGQRVYCKYKGLQCEIVGAANNFKTGDGFLCDLVTSTKLGRTSKLQESSVIMNVCSTELIIHAQPK